MRFKMTAAVLAVAAVLACSTMTMASTNPVGTAAMMDIGMGARALGMGGANIAVADDGAAIYYNPAGLGLMQRRCLTSLYTSQFRAANYMAVGYSQRNIGVGLLRLDASGIEETDEFANVTGVFGVADLTAVAGGGFEVIPNLSLGGALKYYYQSLPASSGWGITGDVGALWTPMPWMSVGVVGRNLLGSVKYKDGESDPFERSFGLGVAFRPMKGLLLAADAVYQNQATLKAGAEYQFGPVALRAGGSWGAGQTSLTAGAGFSVQVLSIDYSYQTHSILPDSHRISISARF
ncbi:MAG: PorV/PorQ family protein [Clostridia bacterium]|nr:PorV/PorQ family protein [Clostridia bacterium]